VLFDDWRARPALKLSAPVFPVNKQEREMAARRNYARKKTKRRRHAEARKIANDAGAALDRSKSRMGAANR
jgi:hypothetical protein